MKRKIFICFLIILVSFIIGFFSHYLITTKNEEPFFVEWFYGEGKNVKGFSFGDKNGLVITGNYGQEGLQVLNIYDDQQNYQQSTVFGKTYDGAIDKETPPEDDEIKEIDSFLSRSEIINNNEIRYYITNSVNPEIMIDE